MKSSEAAETAEVTETAADEVQNERIPRRRKRRFESSFSSLGKEDSNLASSA